MAIFWDNRRVNWYQNANVLDFIVARTMEVLTAAIRSAKLQSNRHHQQTNATFYRPDAFSVAKPTVSEH